MKYKILLTGNNESVIDDFFVQMDEAFEALTTSPRYEDVIRHAVYFAPEVFVYCLSNESRDDIIQMVSVKSKLNRMGQIPMVIIGTQEDCEEFEAIAVNTADLALYRPVSVSTIQEKIIRLLKERRFQEAVNVQGAQTAGGTSAPGTRDKVKHPAASSGGNLQRRHVLVVDDNTMMLKTIKDHLQGQYDVATAINGKAALKFLMKKKTDLILLDYEMPGENGVAVMEKLRSINGAKDIPIVFITGVTDADKIKEALVLKPQGYLIKPIDRDKLLDKIARVLDETGAGERQ